MYETMLAASVAIYLVTISLYLRSGLASLYHPLTLYLGFHGFVFVFRPIMVYYYQFDYVYHVYHFTPSLSDKLTALAAANLGLVTFAYFVTRVGNVPMAFRDDAAHAAERTLLRRYLPIVLAICVPLGVYSLMKAVNNSITGESTMVIKDNLRVNTTDVGYMSEAMLMLIPVCALVAWFWRFRLAALAPLAMFFVLKASTGGRGPFVTAAFATALLYFYDRKTRLPSGRVLALAAGLGLVFSAVGADRGFALREALGLGNQTTDYANETTSALEGQDFANLEYFEYIVYVVPQRSGTYDYFLNNLMLLTEPIPRVLWPGKPVGAPIKMIDWFRYGTPLGMTTSMPGAGWMQLGWIGVLVWCGLWGWALGRFYRWFVTGPQDAISVSLYMVFYSLLIVGFRDGGIVTIARQGIFLITPILLLIVIRRVMKIPKLDVIELLLARTPITTAGRAARAAASPAALPRSVRRRLAAGQPAA